MNKSLVISKTLLIAVYTGLFVACSNGNNNFANSDSANHTAHNETHSGAKNKTEMNPVTQTMEKMMHDMHNAKPTGNNDVDFAVMMIEHHKGAVEMSKVEVTQGINTEMKAFAQKVIDDQNKEIVFMQQFISKGPKSPSPNSGDFQKAMNGSMRAMMSGKTNIYNDIDKDFAAQMIPHHQSAVDMAEAYLKYGKETSLKALCKNIIDSQSKEIDWLKEWLAENQ